VAEATYRAAVARWPAARITPRQGRASDRGQPAPARGEMMPDWSPLLEVDGIDHISDESRAVVEKRTARAGPQVAAEETAGLK
jgi:hypothetical protein